MEVLPVHIQVQVARLHLHLIVALLHHQIALIHPKTQKIHQKEIKNILQLDSTEIIKTDITITIL